MPAKKSLTPKQVLNLWLPLDIRAKLDLTLYSELECRVPKGAYTTLFTRLTREHLEWATLDLAPLGFPPGYFIRGPKEMVERVRLVLENLHENESHRKDHQHVHP